MTASTPIERVAEAIYLADVGAKLADLYPWSGLDSETTGAHYLRIAEAAIEALGLTEERGARFNGRNWEPMRRWVVVGPWVSVSGEGSEQ